MNKNRKVKLKREELNKYRYKLNYDRRYYDGCEEFEDESE